MPKPLETDRLILKPLSANDFPFMRTLQSNPEVMKYIGIGQARTEAQTQVSMEIYSAIEKADPRLGGWIAVLKEKNMEIGSLIMRKPATSENTEGIEIGFSFLPEHWGKGYASEASRALMAYAAQEFKGARLIALVEPSNEASLKTLTKLGFKKIGTTDYVDPSTGMKKPSVVLERAHFDP